MIRVMSGGREVELRSLVVGEMRGCGVAAQVIEGSPRRRQ